MSECTGIMASWCPVHGDCVCPREDDGSPLERHVACVISFHGFPAEAYRTEIVHDDACPLHGAKSKHAESVFA